ncbi:MAG: hypothetical protein IJL70_03325 [Treponema sp.]|nr:hypothetical protein [Treponema sp.]
MKKRFLFVPVLLLCFYALPAQSDTSQFVFPKRVLVGDMAELHYTFSSGVDFFPEEGLLDEKPLFLNLLPFSTDNSDFTLTKAIIQRNGAMYTVVLTFIPWKSGILDFPQFDLYAAVFGSDTVPFIIDPERVEISSLLTDEDTILRPVVPPLLFPGTIYFVYFSIVLFIVVLIFIIQFLIRWRTISDKLNEKRLLRKYAKSSRFAVRQLKKLEKNSSKIQDSAFCLAIQKIFRKYLTVRFGINFNCLATNQFVTAFETATGGVLDGFIVDNMEAIVEIFTRMDYVRFAHNSLESKKMPAEQYAAVLHDGERGELINTSRAIIKLFERGR